MMKFLIAFSSLLGSCLSGSFEWKYPSPQVVTPLGTIEGACLFSATGRPFAAFQGIPYAQPPIGDLRFEVPKSVSAWTDVLMAKNASSVCLQYNLLELVSDDKVTGSEDCLYMNIYTPVTAVYYPTELLPVIFFIHGGDFFFGWGHQYGPEYLLDRDVVLVTFNYRLGPLGFLNTEDDVVPGNMGLKDQVMALRWVNENIQYFGGDPSSITIIGHSAGGASVHYHYLTNITSGLFQRGMSMSGSSLGPCSFVRNPLKKAEKLSGIVGCSTDDTQTMVDCLKNTDGDQIVRAVSKFFQGNFLPSGWAPSVEKGGSDFTFIDQEPIDIITSGGAQDLPWIASAVKDEGLFTVAPYITSPESMVELNDNWESLAPHVLFYDDVVAEDNKTAVAKLIKQHYLGESDISNATITQTAQIMTDRIFCYDILDILRTQVGFNQNPTYLYWFTYRGAHSATEALTGTTTDYGVCHLDDLAYIMYSFFDATTTDEDLAVQKILIDIWTSYAYDGTPSVDGVEWSKYDGSPSDEINFLQIAGPEDIGMEIISDFGSKSFWRSLKFDDDFP